MFNLFNNNSIKKISPSEANAKIKEDNSITILDVRTPQEHGEVRIPNSINIPLDVINQVSSKISNKDQTIYVYCHSGARASAASSQLMKMGYNNVYNLGGIIHWNYDVISGIR